MSTPKQKKAAIKTSENIRKPRPEPIGEVLKASGYSKSISLRPSTVTRSKGYREELEPLLKRHNVTKDQYVKNIGDAMTAEKMNTFTGEITPDYALRLSANKQAKELLNFSDDEIRKDPELAKAITDNLDELELTRLVLKKS